MRTDLPTGTVTFLFTDVEARPACSTSWAGGYADALAEHRRIVREAFARHGGVEVDTQGDAFFIAFPTAPGRQAAAAASAMGWPRADPGPDGDPHRHSSPDRRGLRRGRCPPRGPDRRGWPRRAGARVGRHGRDSSAPTACAISASTASRTSISRSLSTSSATSVSRRCRRSRTPTCPARPARSSAARREVAEVAALLQDDARLVTLTGPGGSGKTRLAIEAAATLVPEFKAGVFWVGLAALRDPALVTETIGADARRQGRPGRRTSGSGRCCSWSTTLSRWSRRPRSWPTLVEACPNLRLLVTSRELLRVRGRGGVPGPAAWPQPTRSSCSARGSGLDPEPTVAELCRRLDNLPLAVELAAARASVLRRPDPRATIAAPRPAEGGRDADARQQTLRSTIEWSYDLLTADEQRLFARLAVFAGGCTVDAAERVIDADLDVLQSLVDKSLVRHTDGRFWMLETIREFAGQESGGHGGGRRHRAAARRVCSGSRRRGRAQPGWKRLRQVA